VSGLALDALEPGRTAVIVDVRGDDALQVRLLEMGLVPGTPITVVKRAPFGDPLELRVRGYHLSLRRAEARRVELRRP
jgi:Fe2+ transport system protein FeoA